MAWIGMIIGGKAIPLYTSARDIGNIAAGIVAAKNGISWSAARIAFDAYQSRNGLQVEGISTRNAEYYGWSQMYSHSNGRYEAANMGASIKSFLVKCFIQYSIYFRYEIRKNIVGFTALYVFLMQE